MSGGCVVMWMWCGGVEVGWCGVVDGMGFYGCMVGWH